jgi:hypothetical protein
MTLCGSRWFRAEDHLDELRSYVTNWQGRRSYYMLDCFGASQSMSPLGCSTMRGLSWKWLDVIGIFMDILTYPGTCCVHICPFFPVGSHGSMSCQAVSEEGLAQIEVHNSIIRHRSGPEGRCCHPQWLLPFAGSCPYATGLKQRADIAVYSRL